MKWHGRCSPSMCVLIKPQGNDWGIRSKDSKLDVGGCYFYMQKSLRFLFLFPKTISIIRSTTAWFLLWRQNIDRYIASIVFRRLWSRCTHFQTIWRIIRQEWNWYNPRTFMISGPWDVTLRNKKECRSIICHSRFSTTKTWLFTFSTLIFSIRVLEILNQSGREFKNDLYVKKCQFCNVITNRNS